MMEQMGQMGQVEQADRTDRTDQGEGAAAAMAPEVSAAEAATAAAEPRQQPRFTVSYHFDDKDVVQQHLMAADMEEARALVLQLLQSPYFGFEGIYSGGQHVIVQGATVRYVTIDPPRGGINVQRTR